MLPLIYHIVLVLLLLVAFYQDWKYRAIHWVLFPILALATTLLFLETQLPVIIVALNLYFLFTVLACLFVYMTWKEKKIINILKAGFGLGDVLFLFAITPLFAGENYILFFISGMLLSGLFHLMITKGNLKARIPLAGYLAIYLIIWEGVNLISINDIFYTAIL